MFNFLKRSRANSRPSLRVGQRWESLETRRMFSFAPVIEVSYEHEVITDLPVDIREGAVEILLPPLDIPFIPLPSQPIWEPEPPTGSPTFGNEEQAADAGESDGGLVDLDNKEYDADAKPTSDPRPTDLRAERDTRAVLQMLATLQYPLADGAEESTAESVARLADPVSSPTTDLLRRGSTDGSLGIVLSTSTYEPEAETRIIAAESLLNLAVPLDSAYDRYQAFEVWGGDEIDSSARNSEALRSSQFSSPANPDEAIAPNFGSNEQPATSLSFVSFIDSSLPTALPQDHASHDAQFWAPIMAFVNRAIQPTWAKAATVVAVGFICQIIRQRRLETGRGQMLEKLRLEALAFLGGNGQSARLLTAKVGNDENR